MEQLIIPQVTVTRSGNEISLSPYSYEYSYNRTIYLTGRIDDMTAMAIVAQLRTLRSISSDEITMLINSPGGSVTAGKAVIDAMKTCGCEIGTVCIGVAASMAAVILASGTKGKRKIHEHAEVMIHQPLAGFEGQATDVSIMCRHLEKIKDESVKMLADATGRSIEEVRADIERDNWMDAEEAVRYGICDGIEGGHDHE